MQQTLPIFLEAMENQMQAAVIPGRALPECLVQGQADRHGRAGQGAWILTRHALAAERRLLKNMI